MIWKNPFLIRQAERIDSAMEFLQLFSSEALSFINEKSFNTIQFVRSSPGAGKTTVFKAMQPNVLSSLNEELEDNEDFYRIAVANKIIETDEVKLLSCIISCAKNYDLIDEMFKNGRRQQILFALLNVRIVVLMLKSIMNIKELQGLTSLDKITFNEYPEECLTISDQISDGYRLYNWAQAEERKICLYLDALSDEPANFYLNYSTLFFVKLFEPHNVLYNGRDFLNYSLIIFDDVEKLTKHQRELLVTTLFTTRPNLGIWIGERLEALSSSEIITNAAMIGREYESIILEEYWKDRGKGIFQNTLYSIARRRARIYSDSIVSYENCLENKLEYKKYQKNLQSVIDTIIDQLSCDDQFGSKYLNILGYINEKCTTLYDKASALMVLDINYKRDCGKKRRISRLKKSYQIKDYESFYKENEPVIKYYLGIRAKLPYYYGFDMLKKIASYNIEQFLAFSGAIFDQYVAKDIMSTKRKNDIKIKPEDQEKCIKQVAEQRYEEILRRFEYGENMQNLFNNLALRSQQTRDMGTIPRDGGAATGVAIKKDSLVALETEKYSKLSKILSDCISSNYFDKRCILHDGQEWVVLYYNRWLCVHYALPLTYGGWFRASINELNSYIQSPDKKSNRKKSPNNNVSLSEV